MSVTQLLPERREVGVEEIVAGLAAPAEGSGGPFSPPRQALCDALSKAILGRRESRARPEMVALAYFVRRGAVSRLAEDFAALCAAGRPRVALGLAFHVPPTNVDTVFAYSLLLSLLA